MANNPFSPEPQRPEPVNRLQWMDFAVCAQTDANVFVPKRRNMSQAIAKSVCAGCEVTVECNEFRSMHDQTSDLPVQGTWAGLDEYERRQLDSKRKPLL